MKSSQYVAPKKGPWIVRPDQARTGYVSTETGTSKMSDYFPVGKLRPDQIIYRKVKRG